MMSLDGIAARIAAARASGVPVPRFAAGHSANDAYAVQDIGTAARRSAGGRTIGRKIGLSSLTAQRMFGVDEPDSGWLWADRQFAHGDVISMPLIAPRVEAEIALVLKRDVDDPDDLEGAIDHALPAIEIVDSAIANWDVALFDTVADNASGWGIVLGGPARSAAGFDLAALGMTLARNDVIESGGNGAATMGGPLAALSWLARHTASRGVPLRAGEIIMTGALGPVLPVRAGDRFEVRIDGFDPLAISFAD